MKFGEKMESEFDIDELVSYVEDRNKYYEKLQKSIDNELWEYASVLTWKIVVLFVYEKMFQMQKIGKVLPDDLIRQLKKECGTSDCVNRYNFSCLKDDNIYSQISNIWNHVEQSYKQLFKQLLDDRNGLSHVNRYEEDFNYDWFKAYFDRSVKLLKYFQELHENQFMFDIYNQIILDNYNYFLSEKDVEFVFAKSKIDSNENLMFDWILDYIYEKSSFQNISESMMSKIKEKLINNFVSSSNFSVATKNSSYIQRLPNLNDNDIITILNDIFEFQGINNQILQADGVDLVLRDLLEKSISQDMAPVWQNFYLKCKDEGYLKYLLKFDKTFSEMFN